MNALMIRFEVPDEGVADVALRELQATVAEHAVGEAPTPQPLEVLGTYGF
ncbi:hypothetical protein [Nonomuraea sediminis]|nr:hypothetical protein [Nonomuraea sediminis]